MKYIRGYLVAGIFLALSWLLSQLGSRLSQLIDMVYPYVTRSIQTFLAQWSSSVDFLIWQVLALALIVILLATVVLMVLLRWNVIQWLGWVLAAASVVVFLHTGIYGLNNYAGPIADDVRLETSEYTAEELLQATEYYRDKANDLAKKIRRDADGKPAYSSFEELAADAGMGFETLTYDESLAVFAGCTLPVKKLGWADMYTSMGITGFTFPLTGEAAVNPQTPAVSLPFTMCHEMAHRMSIAPERDANFAAFLACRYNPYTEFQYSAYFMAYRYCYNSLAGVYGAGSDALAKVKYGESELLRQDTADYSAFFNTHRNETATQVADKVNDTYIKASGDEQGVLSYGEVSDYLVDWYIQQIIAPTLEEEAQKFDPFDETQVDLSGLPYTPTEATEEETEE